jgi:hypothetical protein
MGGAGGTHWAICCYSTCHTKYFGAPALGPRLYPLALTKSVGLQTLSMSCPPTYDSHKNIRWCKTRWCVLRRCGFRAPPLAREQRGQRPPAPWPLAAGSAGSPWRWRPWPLALAPGPGPWPWPLAPGPWNLEMDIPTARGLGAGGHCWGLGAGGREGEGRGERRTTPHGPCAARLPGVSLLSFVVCELWVWGLWFVVVVGVGGWGMGLGLGRGAQLEQPLPQTRKNAACFICTCLHPTPDSRKLVNERAAHVSHR